jgi:glycosyltransferase involved in cell wall biosynthesis
LTRISIAMATYEGERFLAEQLDSLAGQTLLPDEVVIGDDGSTDGTEAIVRAFAAKAPFPVSFSQNPERLGFGENFIQAALRCKGDWIGFCDQDDVWAPGKLERIAGEIARGPENLMLTAHNATVTDEQLRPLRRLYEYPRRRLSQRLGLPPEYYCIGATQVFRGDLLREIKPSRRVSFPWHSHHYAHDVWVALLANATGSILRIGEPLMFYRRHGDTVTDQALGEATTLERSGDGYLERAAYLHDAAAALRECAINARPDLRTLLEEAGERFDAQSAVLAIRASAYREPRLSGRIAALSSLVRSGAYLGRQPWRFGVKRLVKDVLCALRIV